MQQVEGGKLQSGKALVRISAKNEQWVGVWQGYKVSCAYLEWSSAVVIFEM